jgi:hypothetical protein
VGDLHFGSGTTIPCPFCEAGISVTTKVVGPTMFELITAANLVIRDGVVIKNRFGSIGRSAEEGDYERADLIIVDGQVVRNMITTR